MGTTMSYGGNNITPVPLISVEKTFNKTPAGMAIGTSFIVTLRGTLINTTDGLPGILNDRIRYIRETFDRDGKYFEIACNGQTLFEGYPRIIQAITFNESNDNWTVTAPYQLTLEFDNEPANVNTNYINISGENIGTTASLMPPFITEAEDTWSFEPENQTARYDLNTSSGIDSNSLIVRATHEVSAVGKSHYDGPLLQGTLTKQAWQWAKDYVNTKMNQSPLIPLASGLLNVATGSWGIFDHYRVQKLSETAGSFGISESFVLTSNNTGVIEDFNVEVRGGGTEPLSTVSIQGSIQGLEKRDYGLEPTGFNIISTKFANASGYFDGIKDYKLIYPRAQALITNEGFTLNIIPLTRIIGKSPSKGLITYQYEYNTRPSNCIAGALQENISISDDNPSDIFSKIAVMGRSQGPILQSFNTVSEFRRSVNIDAIMTPPTGCTLLILSGTNNPHASVASILCTFESDLRTRYNRVFKERDTSAWDPKGGRYNRSVTWVAVDCTNAPPIFLCSGA
jgi:hypothetical protein